VAAAASGGAGFQGTLLRIHRPRRWVAVVRAATSLGGGIIFAERTLRAAAAAIRAAPLAAPVAALGDGTEDLQTFELQGLLLAA
jgi:hypothetical protein